MRGRALGVLIAVLAVVGFLLLVRAGARHAWRGLLDTVGWEMSWFEIGRKSHTFELAGANTIVIENRFGDVQVLPGGPQVKVESTLRAQGKNVTEARRRATGLGVKGAREGAEMLKITGLPGDADHHLRMDLALYAPPEVAVEIKSTAGDIAIRDWHAPVSVSAAVGSVEVSSCDHAVTIQAFAGNVRMRSVSGPVSIECAAGDTTVEEAQGPIDLYCKAGQAVLRGIRSDRVTAVVSCGNLEIGFAEPFSGTCTAESSTGNITIAVPKGSCARVISEASLGSITDNLHSDVLCREGPGLIQMKASVGSISLLEATPDG